MFIHYRNDKLNVDKVICISDNFIMNILNKYLIKKNLFIKRLFMKLYENHIKYHKYHLIRSD